MIHSREDNRVSPADAEREFNKIGSRVDSSEKRLAWITGAGHVITVDYGKEHVFELVADWLDHHRAAMPRERRA
jgi:esterase/lipase